jgi:hypothetical protein
MPTPQRGFPEHPDELVASFSIFSIPFLPMFSTYDPSWQAVNHVDYSDRALVPLAKESITPDPMATFDSLYARFHIGTEQPDMEDRISTLRFGLDVYGYVINPP